MRKVFLSFNFDSDMNFISKVNYFLNTQPGIKTFLYEKSRHGGDFNSIICDELKSSDCFVCFCGESLGKYQSDEVEMWMAQLPAKGNAALVCLEERSCCSDPILSRFSVGVDPIQVPNKEDRSAMQCAKELSERFVHKWVPYDGIPNQYLFDYEKEIISEFASSEGKPNTRYLNEGCPDSWPKVVTREILPWNSPLLEEEVGSFRPLESAVLVDIRSEYHSSDNSRCLSQKGLTFLEAGPREKLQALNRLGEPLRVGIIVSGGIAPGINAVIAGLVDRHILYWHEQYLLLQENHQDPPAGLILCAYRDGFAGVKTGRKHKIKISEPAHIDPQQNEGLALVMRRANEGGSMFGTSRCDELSDRENVKRRNEALDGILAQLRHDRIDILYVIGGDGSMKSAHALHTRNKEKAKNDLKNSDINVLNTNELMTVVGIPKTMDNDVLWVWQSFGFMSAVEKATEYLRLLHTEAVSNPRLCVIQLFGSDSGFTVSHAALSCLQCDAALIPEKKFDMDGLFSHVRKRLKQRLSPVHQNQSPYGMIVMAETAVPEDWYRYVNWDEHCSRVDKKMEDVLSSIQDEKIKNKILEWAKDQKGDFTMDLGRDEIEAMITFFGNERRVFGQTPDPLRTVSLKLVSQVLQHRIRTDKAMGSQQYWTDFRVFTSEPRHLLRSSPPSASDIIIGRRFGTLAVDNALAGCTDFMISQWLTEYVLVPLSLVVLGRKRVPDTGIFWKSVLAKTGQPLEMIGDVGNRPRPSAVPPNLDDKEEENKE